MKKNQKFYLFQLIIFTNLALFGGEDSAYMHLNQSMDLFHESFYVYNDYNSGGNHYYPSGIYNGDANIDIVDNYTFNPAFGCTCIKVEWNGLSGMDGWKWNGLMFQEPENNWVGSNGGYNLTGAGYLSFYAKSEEADLILKIIIGYPDDSSGEIIEYVQLNSSWTLYEFDLSTYDLSNICGGFAFFFTDILDPDPDGCIFYLDEIKYTINKTNEPHLMLSYNTDCSKSDIKWAVNQAYTYDNALVMLAYLANGSPSDIDRAKILGDAFQNAQENDRHFTDGRLRNAYMTGDILNHQTGKAKLPGWWDEVSQSWFEDTVYQTGTHTGSMAWSIIAWLTYDEITGENRYLNSAITLGEWIFDSCYNASNYPGYIGGFIGSDLFMTKELWKSTEHNIDVYVAFTRLGNATGDSIWYTRADFAWSFVESMWDPVTEHFWTGTDASGNINNTSPLDIQVWALLAKPWLTQFDNSLCWIENNCYVDTLGYHGFNFSTENDGIWWEGTAQATCAYSLKGEGSKYFNYLNQLRNWQIENNPTINPNGNEKGIVATLPDSLFTGFFQVYGKWNYYNRLHIGATAWYLFAEKSYNPYWNEKMSIKIDLKANLEGCFNGINNLS